MNKITQVLFLLLFIFSQQESYAQTTLDFNGGFATFISGSGTQFGSVTLSDGIDYTAGADATGGFTFVSRNGIGQISYSQSGTLNYFSFSRTDGSEFQLDNIDLQLNISNTTTFTISGFRDGTMVSGASEVVTFTQNVAQLVDVSANAAFDNVDEIRFTFSTAPDNNGNILLNSLTYSAAIVGCTSPTDQVTGINFGTETSSSLTLSNFTGPAGGADGYVIFINDNNSFVAPSDGDQPFVDTNWNNAGQQPVFFGASTIPNVSVNNLDPGTTYFFQVYAYNDCDGTETYETIGSNASDDTQAGAVSITGLTGDDKSYDGTPVATASGVAVLSGVLAGDNVTLTGAPVYTFASSNVGAGITINTTGFALSGPDANKYILTQPTLSADITALELTIIGLTGDNKIYDGTTNATATGTATLSGIIGTDDVVLGGSPAFTFASSNVGVGISINASGYTISGADAVNYTVTQPTLSADISSVELTITGLTADNKIYDGTDTATVLGSATLSGVIGSDDVVLGGTPTFIFATANVGTAITVNTTGYSISGTDSGNYSLTQPILSADITPSELTVIGLTGDDKAFDGTTSATASGTPTLSGVFGSDDVSLGGSPVFTFASPNVGTGITINTNGFSISGTDSLNYTLTQPTLSADITGTELTIVGLAGDDKEYDQTTSATASGSPSLSGVLGSDDVTISGTPTLTFASANVGTGITINVVGYTLSGADAANYSLTQPTLSAKITAKELTVTGLTADNKIYDGTDAAVTSGTATLSGVIGSDDVVLGGAPTFTFATDNVGTAITVNSTGFSISGTDSGNYTLTQPVLSTNITPAELTIVGLTGDNKAFDGTTDATASGTATLSGVIGSDDVVLGGTPTFTFASPNIGVGITINTTGFTISGVDSGNYSLTQPTLSADITGDTLVIDSITTTDAACEGVEDGTATVNISGGTAPFSYEWSTGDVTSVNTLGGLAGGDYSVTVIDASNNSVSQDFTIEEGTSFDITVTEDPTVYLGYFPASFAWIGVDQISGGVAPYTYEWNTGETSERIHVCPTETTNYTVTVTDSRGCSTSAEITVNVIDIQCGNHRVSICYRGKTFCVPVWKVRWYLWRGATLGACDPNSTEVVISEVRVFPNPFKNHLFVRFRSNNDANVDLIVFDRHGNQVFDKQKTIQEGMTKVRMNLRHLKRGIYYLKIVVDGDVKKVKRVIKR